MYDFIMINRLSKSSSGTYCEKAEHACVRNNCINGGTCKLVDDTTEDYKCDCPDGYHGTHCEYEINECLNNPCANGGKCLNREGDFECNCTTGWTGKTCQIGKGFDNIYF